MTLFEVGQAICVPTLLPVEECPHCKSLQPSSCTVRVTAVEDEKGIEMVPDGK